MTTAKPAVRPAVPHFSSGPCAKRPGWTPANLKDAVVGRSHRAKVGKARLKLAIDLTREVLAELCTQIDAAAQARGRAAAISVNWPQAVLQVRFVDAAQPVETESLEDI